MAENQRGWLSGLRDWLFGSKLTTARQIVIVRSTSLRLSNWKSDPSLVRQAYDLQQTPLLSAMVAVLRNESPLNYGLPLGANHDDRIAHACRAEGYQMALNNLEEMAKLTEEHEQIVSEFKPEVEYVSEPIPAVPDNP